MRGFMLSILLGIVGLAVGCGVVQFAVSQWTSLSTDWLIAAIAFPGMGLLGGYFLTAAKTDMGLGKLRFALALASIVLCGLGNYLAFIITSRTWFSREIPAGAQDFFFQVLHPDVLPTFVHRGSGGHGAAMAQTWLSYAITGMVAGPLVFWWSTRKATAGKPLSNPAQVPAR